MNEEDNTEKQLIKKACDQLIEHFDTVHVFCTRDNPQEDGTTHWSFGRGNWFARYGQVTEWLISQNALRREVE